MTLITPTRTNAQRDPLPFTVPLTAENHRVAREFYQQHSDPLKARQVYLNTLSVQSVNFYLKCLGVETKLDQSQSWNPVLQVFADTADLWVCGLGRLECRPVLPDMRSCIVPPEVWADRIGYVFVQLNAELTEAMLLGFVPTVATETLLLQQLQSLNEFPDYLSNLTPVQSSPISTVLSHWLHNLVDSGWESVGTLMEELQGQQPAFSFRTPLLGANAIEPSTEGVKQGKLLTLGQTPEDQVLFLVGIAPAQDTPEFNITVELYPMSDRSYLPRSLQLAVLDETGSAVLQAEGSNSEGLEFQFSGEPGERFDIKVSLNELNAIEAFEI